jgi:CheY-like chemotaxis protein
VATGAAAPTTSVRRKGAIHGGAGLQDKLSLRPESLEQRRRACLRPELRQVQDACTFNRLVAPPSSPPLIGLRVLVVDDDRVALTMLSAMLRAAGADVDGASSGTEALERVGKTRFDFLLCDVYMPEVDGFEVVRRLRQLGPVGEMPAVAITAHPSFENRRDALRAGFTDLVSKPVDPAALVDLVLKLSRKV